MSHDKTTEFFESLRNDILGSIHSGIIARVQTFTRTPLEATVVPLYSIADKQAIPQPMNPITLPVNIMWAGNCFIIPDYKNGDLVYCAPGMNDFRSVLSSGTNITLNESYHALENMHVAHGIKPDSISIPSSLPQSGTIIGHVSGQSYVNISDLKIEVKAPEVIVNSQVVKVGDEATLEKSPKGETLKSVLEALGDIVSGLTTAGGPSNQAADPATQAAVASWKATLESFLSTMVKNS